MQQPTDDELAKQRESVELDLAAWDGQNRNPLIKEYHRDVSYLTRLGLYTLQWGPQDLSRPCFQRALPQLLEDLGPAGPPETAEDFFLTPAPEPSPEIPGATVITTAVS